MLKIKKTHTCFSVNYGNNGIAACKAKQTSLKPEPPVLHFLSGRHYSHRENLLSLKLSSKMEKGKYKNGHSHIKQSPCKLALAGK